MDFQTWFGNETFTALLANEGFHLCVFSEDVIVEHAFQTKAFVAFITPVISKQYIIIFMSEWSAHDLPIPSLSDMPVAMRPKRGILLHCFIAIRAGVLGPCIVVRTIVLLKL